MTQKYKALELELGEIEARGLLRKQKLIDGPIGPRVRIDGRETLLLCTNDYLGLANHPSVKRAAKDAVERYGSGAGASRLVSGTLRIHSELEAALTRLKGTDAAIAFGSGYLANIGTISALMQEGDLIYSDELNHASIVDACRLSRAAVRIYPHADARALAKMLADGAACGRRLIVTDGVFSMDGDLAPLPELARLASEFDCYLMVDDAHATGVVGPEGKGTASHFGLEGSVEIQMGTLSKAIGSYGAFVAGRRELIDYLVNMARSFIFTTALPPAAAGAALEALRIMEREPERRERLWHNASLLKQELAAAGFNLGASETFIIPVVIGDAGECVRMAEALLEEGVFAQAIRPPSVPVGASRLRVVPTAEHGTGDIEFALAAFARAGRKCGLI
ncbi:MAG: 8-amino-7-oxononanoate synthase [Candidatus Hydrogenedentota bacterium]|nr:MAG: 8-amino-7-oxononanoate synthase [Candidatus Hydrogenedentota bacterium]